MCSPGRVGPLFIENHQFSKNPTDYNVVWWDGEEEGEKGKKWVKIKKQRKKWVKIEFLRTVLSLDQRLKTLANKWITVKFS